jgi:N-acetylglucosamine kinase-like BadF-type ATPase
MGYVVGVDGGGTKTAAVVVSPDIRVLGHALAGPANARSAGLDSASAEIARAVTGALNQADIPLSTVEAICLCLAGFDTDLDLPVPQAAMHILSFTGPALFENDVVGAWAGATQAQPGIVAIAGTGSTALGMNEAGAFWRTDGWDYVLGDDGSGYAIGLAGIRAALRALDGRDAPTLLARQLQAAFGTSDAEEMRRLWDGGHLGKREIAGFSEGVDVAAYAGDAVARSILAAAGEALGASVAAIVRRLGMANATMPVSTVGGVFNSQPWVVEPFRARVTAAAPHAVFRPPAHPPEVGAAILAMRRVAEGDLGSWTLGTGKRRIQRTLRVADLFPADELRS